MKIIREVESPIEKEILLPIAQPEYIINVQPEHSFSYMNKNLPDVLETYCLVYYYVRQISDDLCLYRFHGIRKI